MAAVVVFVRVCVWELEWRGKDRVGRLKIRIHTGLLEVHNDEPRRKNSGQEKEKKRTEMG